MSFIKERVKKMLTKVLEKTEGTKIEKTMDALVFEAPGKMSMQVKDVPEIGPGEALVKVIYAGICGTDVSVFKGLHPTATYPLTPGHEFVGELVKYNQADAEDRFQIGDTVVAQEILSCGTCDACAKGNDNVCVSLRIQGVHTEGCFANYVKVPIKKMYVMPKGVDLKIAALTEPLAVAVHDVRRSGLQAGETAFIAGGGPIGLLIAIVARWSGASKVVVSEISEERRNFIEEMGFIAVNPMDEDFIEQLDKIHGGRKFDVSYEAAGAPGVLNTCIKITKNTGKVVVIAICKSGSDIDAGEVFAKELTLIGVRIHSQYNFVGAVDAVASGVLNDDLEKLISSVYPLSQAEDAINAAVSGKGVFKILIDCRNDQFFC